jgi:hypothetical protein
MMKEEEITTGKWEVRQTENGDFNVVVVFDDDLEMRVAEGMRKSDAILVASAPMMLRVLEQYASEFCEFSDQFCGSLDDDECSGCNAKSMVRHAKGTTAYWIRSGIHNAEQ